MLQNLSVDNVRCFRDHHDIEIRPLTIVLGENSTGKSTILALAQIAHAAASKLGRVDFNIAPFELGAFDQIAHFHGGKGKRATEFAIGGSWSFPPRRRGPHPASAETVRVQARFDKQHSQPRLTEWSLTSGDDLLRIFLRDAQAVITMTTPETGTLTSEFSSTNLGTMGLDAARLSLFRLDAGHSKGSTAQTSMLRLHRLLDRVDDGLGRVVPLAPIRSRPERTYNPTSEHKQPEGSHVPMVMARMKSENEQTWRDLVEKLASFGSEAGLFRAIDIKRKGSGGSDPFQVHLSPSKYAFNMIDVGYGISQSLPVVVEALLAPPDTMFLVQQPEVHLHPRAQAQLGSFFSQLVAKDRKRFIVESHSDYFLDRIRMDIRDRKSVSAEDVLVLYCERANEGVKVHGLTFNADGEFATPPPQSYRQFFLEEERRFLIAPARNR